MAEVPDRVELVRSGGFANIPVRASVPGARSTRTSWPGVDAILAREPADRGRAGCPDRDQYDVTWWSGRAATASASASARSTSTCARSSSASSATPHERADLDPPAWARCRRLPGPAGRDPLRPRRGARDVVAVRPGPRRRGPAHPPPPQRSVLRPRGRADDPAGPEGKGVAAAARARSSACRRWSSTGSATRPTRSCATSTSTRPGVGFADYMRALRDGRTLAYDQEPPPRGGHAPGDRRRSSGRDGFRADGMTLLADIEEIAVAHASSDLAGPPGAARSCPPRRVALRAQGRAGDHGRRPRAPRAGPARGSQVPAGVAHAVSSPAPARFVNLHTPSCGFGAFLRALAGHRRRGARGPARRLRSAAGAPR